MSLQYFDTAKLKINIKRNSVNYKTIIKHSKRFYISIIFLKHFGFKLLF